ncbi:hypothetical protein CC86DRAFT_394335 [Ophiobolus disseminans]|uniref:Uncharacterized protein n=1 Tax=Ophiobolus disseminans TaxID=1469910 RepID=A0A6A7A0B4_9PLEO|nr:hypothetical protein CC86DRAFT_394335 [Ophiobolus disseminans]
MATGVEAAGLVLGSIPLILAGLQFYAEGISVTKRYWRYREEVNGLLAELRTENSLYINSINMLLIGVVEQKDMAVFLADPGGEKWKEPKFDRRLQKRLGSSYSSYLETINLLMATAERFKERLKLNKFGKPQFTERNAFKEHFKRLKFSLGISQADYDLHYCRDYKELMDRLRQANQSLYRMTVQTSHLAAAHQTSINSVHQTAPNFTVIKDQAESFHRALSNSWNCPCMAGHSVSLRLETRTNELSSDDEDEEPTQDPFHVLFRYDHRHSPGPSLAKPWTWEEADVRFQYETQATIALPTGDVCSGKGVRFAKQAIPKAVQAALEPHPNLQPIQDLCSAISTLQNPQRDVCFSLLANEIAKQKYGVLLITPIKQLPPDTNTWSVSSLRTQNTGNDILDLLTEFKSADRLAEALLSEAGARYSDAVRRCIRCDFDQRASSLEDARFQKAVYHGVVAQLQENYEYLFQDHPD